MTSPFHDSGRPRANSHRHFKAPAPSASQEPSSAPSVRSSEPTNKLGLKFLASLPSLEDAVNDDLQGLSQCAARISLVPALGTTLIASFGFTVGVSLFNTSPQTRLGFGVSLGLILFNLTRASLDTGGSFSSQVRRGARILAESMERKERMIRGEAELEKLGQDYSREKTIDFIGSLKVLSKDPPPGLLVLSSQLLTRALALAPDAERLSIASDRVTQEVLQTIEKRRDQLFDYSPYQLPSSLARLALLYQTAHAESANGRRGALQAVRREIRELCSQPAAQPTVLELSEDELSFLGFEEPGVTAQELADLHVADAPKRWRQPHTLKGNESAKILAEAVRSDALFEVVIRECNVGLKLRHALARDP